MAAILGLNTEQIKAICTRWPNMVLLNHNYIKLSRQIVLAGETEAIKQAMAWHRNMVLNEL